MTACSPSEPFHAVAPYYDRLMCGIPYLWWFHYIEVLLEHVFAGSEGFCPHTMLDLCCGTGNLTELFHVHGYEVVGVDISAPMIEQARRKAESKGYPIAYYVQDAAELELPHTFDLVVSVFDSLNNILEPARFARCFQRVYRHLNTPGAFVFDLNTEYAFTHRMFDQSELRHTAPVRYRWRSRYDPNTQLCTVRMEFWVREGEQERYFVEIHQQRAYAAGEVRTMLHEAGFRKVHAFDAYTLNPPTRRSDRVFYVAVR
jgi:ubiquinone/menaquinone biosynthesis C-methylase UbiE